MTLVGLVASVGGAAGDVDVDAASITIEQVALALGVFGFGFGLTVTPRSTAAVEAAGRGSFGIASAVVTVARMIGMAVGLAILTAYGSTTIDRLYDQVYATPDAYLAVHPRGPPRPAAARPVRRRGARGLGVARGGRGSWSGCSSSRPGSPSSAIPPALALGGRRRRRVCSTTPRPRRASGAAAAGSAPEPRDGIERGEPTVVL